MVSALRSADRGGRVAPAAADPSQATGRVKRRENQFTAPAYQKFKSSPLQRGVCELSVPCGASNFSSGRQQRVGLWPSPEDPLSPGTCAVRRAAPTAGGTPRTLSLNTRSGFGRSNDISYRRVKLSRISVAFGAQVGAAAVRFAASGLPTRSRGIEQGRIEWPCPRAHASGAVPASSESASGAMNLSTFITRASSSARPIRSLVKP